MLGVTTKVTRHYQAPLLASQRCSFTKSVSRSSVESTTTTKDCGSEGSLLLEKVLVKGHPLLSQPTQSVTEEIWNSTSFRQDCQRLCDTLQAFRSKHGYGRAIAGPQIGLPYRVLALNLTTGRNADHYLNSTSSLEGASPIGAFCLINPEITWKSKDETRTLWDDCLSLPDTMVRVRRYERIQVEWTPCLLSNNNGNNDNNGDNGDNDNDNSSFQERIVWMPNQLIFDLSELLQHEIDHLEGRLATDLVEHYYAEGRGRQEQYPSMVSRTEFEQNIEHYKSYVDYVI